MPLLDLSDEELQQFIQVCATASGPGITWLVCNNLLQKAQAAAQGQQRVATTGEHGVEVIPSRAPLNEQMQYDAMTRPLEPPHRRRANSEDR